VKKDRRRAAKDGVKGARARWTEVVDAALSDGDRSVAPRYKAAYKRLVRYETPGPEELKTTDEA
jgi:hypothetical protein